ncbi:MULTISPECIES: bifunctional GNAT family N-acetyltransferase/acetate--CoA ligase family protein [Streptomyces]|uniref:GNAT family N-acetyltransferase n=1 Tax=Streptomyces caniscabiei TaxID=2746961 RepID=A0ABU4N2E1_9ACTN|nr:MULTISPECIES: bifunctional GNAT family N-acetyltransferase/acetate--CoA ligase family protein [Streptomyces]MBE4733514.1 GNAT family N-acetyltransferase [Streptomyces caniscabiei]MBE4754691.1 GNAT family N-acetyltransferase [Streptomyces caniscabiei]MBE4768488.1 GNAT family N-acetyltransferase [Streptomyces caniscabiei]MBE4782009.1 GNAT family N-acetyltransferase [Streptomyces caniscabiei]MBE4793298.1 GNAT family N-acetyltransferase [Streptomyces caniscabiei]
MTDDVLSRPPVHALLADGTTVRIRAVERGDHDQLQGLYEEMSSENLRLRFFAASRRSAEQAADRACAPPRQGYRALLAERAGQVIGLAEYETGEDAGTAEISIAVADGLHHRGVGTLLIEHLVSAARAEGITTFTADALSENSEVLRLFSDLGLSMSRSYDGPEVRCAITLTEDDIYLTAVEARGRAADVASLEPLLRPRAVAVIGAGRKPGSVGRAVLHHLRTGGFTGRLFAVNPAAASLLGVPCHPSVAALPRTPDLAVVAVPAAAVPATAEECGKAGVRALLVVTAGLDRDQARALRDACRTHGMRLVGPNCLGISHTDPAVRLDATFAAGHPSPGTAGVAVQSGGVGIALLDGLSRLGIGVSSFASLGDKYDVSGNDMLQWWESDGRTDLALLHLESFGNPRAFSRTARRVTRRMPVLTVDAGRTEAGRRAAASHTAAAATPTMTRRALFTQAGVTATGSVGELLETAALLHSQPLPKGFRVAVLTNAGGAGVLAADACVEAGLLLPAFTPELAGDLLAVLPGGASVGNPVDATAAVTEERLKDAVERVLRHGGIDAVLLALVPTAVATATGDDLIRALTDAPGPRPKPVVAVRLEQDLPVRLLPATGGGTVPSYAEPQAAARALTHAARRAAWLARPAGTVPHLDGIDPGRAHDLVDTFLSVHPDGGWLDPRACADLLSCYGIPQIPWAWAETEDAAVLAADRLRGPDGRVVMKAHWPGLVHKSEQRAVHLDLQGDSQVRAAFRDFETRFGDLLAGVIVQPLAPRGTELFAGVVQDEVFGPLVLFGLGGTATEVLGDHAARLAPLTDHDVHDLITAPRCAPLLFGARGSGPVDLERLERLLLGLSRMAADLPQLAEADFNPVLATSAGVSVLDARVRLLPRRPQDPYLRRLR